MGPETAALVGVLGIANGGRLPNIFATFGRHRRLFRSWLGFAATVSAFGSLGRRDTELIVLRTAWNSGSFYVWTHHRRLARVFGLSAVELDRIADGPAAAGWEPWDEVLLQAVDELCHDQVIADGTWTRLWERYDEKRFIELCFLVGHYQMLAMGLNSLGVQHEREPIPE